MAKAMKGGTGEEGCKEEPKERGMVGGSGASRLLGTSIEVTD